MIIKGNLGRYPSRWHEYSDTYAAIPPSVFGFQEEIGQINRWAARFRAANSFTGITLVDYKTDETIHGYSALVHSTLVWSAFERYLRLIGQKQGTCSELLETYDPDSIANTIRTIDIDTQLYSYIRSKVDGKNIQLELDNYLKGEQCNVSYLLSAIRHIFGHGHLTPSPGEANAVVTTKICKTLNAFHLKVMDDDFWKRVIRGKQDLHPIFPAF